MRLGWRCREFAIAHCHALRIRARIVVRLDGETRRGGRRRDQLDNRSQTGQRLAVPVHDDEAKPAVFDSVPLGGARWVATGSDGKTRPADESSELHLPGTHAVAIRPTGFGGDQERGGRWRIACDTI